MYLSFDVKEKGLNEEVANEIIDFLSLTRKCGFEPETKALQNIVYPYYKNTKIAQIDSELCRVVYGSLNFE